MVHMVSTALTVIVWALIALLSIAAPSSTLDWPPCGSSDWSYHYGAASEPSLLASCVPERWALLSKFPATTASPLAVATTPSSTTAAPAPSAQPSDSNLTSPRLNGTTEAIDALSNIPALSGGRLNATGGPDDVWANLSQTNAALVADMDIFRAPLCANRSAPRSITARNVFLDLSLRPVVTFSYSPRGRETLGDGSFRRSAATLQSAPTYGWGKVLEGDLTKLVEVTEGRSLATVFFQQRDPIVVVDPVASGVAELFALGATLRTPGEHALGGSHASIEIQIGFVRSFDALRAALAKVDAAAAVAAKGSTNDGSGIPDLGWTSELFGRVAEVIVCVVVDAVDAKPLPPDRGIGAASVDYANPSSYRRPSPQSPAAAVGGHQQSIEALLLSFATVEIMRRGGRFADARSQRGGQGGQAESSRRNGGLTGYYAIDGAPLTLTSGWTLGDLLPASPVYYTYQGSSSMPPCRPSVRWIVFAERAWISLPTLEWFRHWVLGYTPPLLESLTREATDTFVDQLLLLHVAPSTAVATAAISCLMLNLSSATPTHNCSQFLPLPPYRAVVSPQTPDTVGQVDVALQGAATSLLEDPFGQPSANSTTTAATHETVVAPREWIRTLFADGNHAPLVSPSPPTFLATDPTTRSRRGLALSDLTTAALRVVDRGGHSIDDATWAVRMYGPAFPSPRKVPLSAAPPREAPEMFLRRAAVASAANEAFVDMGSSPSLAVACASLAVVLVAKVAVPLLERKFSRQPSNDTATLVEEMRTAVPNNGGNTDAGYRKEEAGEDPQAR